MLFKIWTCRQKIENYQSIFSSSSIKAMPLLMGKIKLVQQTHQSVILKELSGKICAELFSMVGKA
jgi:hypothetical protein